jgi:hypothetical protein
VRPVLNPALRRLWRDETTLQIGLDPQRALVLRGVDPSAARFVESLDGTRTLPAAIEAAPRIGLDETRARRLLDLLRSGGALADAAADQRPLSLLPPSERDRLAPDLASLSLVHPTGDGGAAVLARRREAAVLVVGGGRIGAGVATLLAASGVAHVTVTDRGVTRAIDANPAGLPADAVGRPREDAARAAMRRVAGAVGAEPPTGRRDPDVAVLAPVGPLDRELADRLLRRGVAHLVVGIRETVGVVGPLVLPGESSCLRCADLARTDRDPAWPAVAAQLATAQRPDSVPCDGVLATLVAAQAALQVLALIDCRNRPPTVDGTLETRLPDGVTRRRSWRPHPACGCRWSAAS